MTDETPAPAADIHQLVAEYEVNWKILVELDKAIRGAGAKVRDQAGNVLASRFEIEYYTLDPSGTKVKLPNINYRILEVHSP